MQENRHGLRKSTIAILIIAGVMILGGIALAIAGAALGGLHDLRDITISGHKIYVHGQEPLETVTVETDPFTNIDIDAFGSTVSLVDDTDWYVVCRCESGRQPFIVTEDDTLYIVDYISAEGGSVVYEGGADAPTGIKIEDGEGNTVRLGADGLQVSDGSSTVDIDLSGFVGVDNYEAPSIEIHCPMSTAFGNVRLRTSWLETGDMRGLTAQTLEFDTDGGDFTIEGANIGTLTGRYAYGGLFLRNCTFGEIALADKDDGTGGMESVELYMSDCEVSGGAAFSDAYGLLDLRGSKCDSLTAAGESLTVRMENMTVAGETALDVRYSGDDIEIENSTFGSLDMAAESESLSAEISNLTVTGMAAISCNYAEVEMENCTLGGLDAKMNDGDIDLRVS